MSTSSSPTDPLLTAGPVAATLRGVVHDVTNLAATILNYAAMLEEDLADRPESREDAREITAAARRLTALLDDLREVAGRRDGTDHDIDVRALLSGCHGELRDAAAPAALDLALGDGPARVQIDPLHLRDAVLELARNAGSAAAARIRVSAVDGDGTVTIVVADDGPGMAPDLARRAGWPFVTGGHRALGRGLGLSRVTALAERTGGRLDLDVQGDTGLRASLVLPAADVVAS